jgi:alpha-mannosidase
LRRTHASSPFSDLGRHAIALAVGRHSADAPRDEQAAAVADLLFTAPLPYQGRPCSAGFLGLEGGESLQPVWAKPSDQVRGAWVLRLNEVLGRRGRARLLLAPGWRARRVDLSERSLGPAPGLKSVDFAPYALISLRLEKS